MKTHLFYIFLCLILHCNLALPAAAQADDVVPSRVHFFKRVSKKSFKLKGIEQYRLLLDKPSSPKLTDYTWGSCNRFALKLDSGETLVALDGLKGDNTGQVIVDPVACLLSPNGAWKKDLDNGGRIVGQLKKLYAQQRFF